MKSARVTLTLVATMGMALRAQGPNPCASVTFDEKACKASIRYSGFCSQGAWVPVTYHEQYPYYYDIYRNYLSAGGIVTPAKLENCRRSGGHGSGAHGVSRGGFGAIGHGGHE
jgi:hypothetical protein